MNYEIFKRNTLKSIKHEKSITDDCLNLCNQPAKYIKNSYSITAFQN